MTPETLELDVLQRKNKYFSPLVLSPITPGIEKADNVSQLHRNPKSHLAQGLFYYCWISRIKTWMMWVLAFVGICIVIVLFHFPIEPVLGDVATPRSNQLASDPRATIDATLLASSQRSWSRLSCLLTYVQEEPNGLRPLSRRSAQGTTLGQHNPPAISIIMIILLNHSAQHITRCSCHNAMGPVKLNHEIVGFFPQNHTTRYTGYERSPLYFAVQTQDAQRWCPILPIFWWLEGKTLLPTSFVRNGDASITQELLLQASFRMVDAREDHGRTSQTIKVCGP